MECKYLATRAFKTLARELVKWRSLAALGVFYHSFHTLPLVPYRSSHSRHRLKVSYSVHTSKLLTSPTIGAPIPHCMFRVALCKSRSTYIPPIWNLRVTVYLKPSRRMASLSNIRDPNTLANYNVYRTTHTIANLDIDFDKRCLSGNVVLNLKCHNPIERPDILLDTSHLDIGDVKLDGEKAEYELHARVEPYGSALRIKVTPDHAKEEISLDVSCEPS